MSTINRKSSGNHVEGTALYNILEKGTRGCSLLEAKDYFFIQCVEVEC